MLLPVPAGADFDQGFTDWKPATGVFGTAFVAGEDRLALIRALADTRVKVYLSMPAEEGSPGKDRSFQFGPEPLPAKAWAVVAVLARSKEPLVYLSKTGKDLDSKFRLLPDGTARPEPVERGSEDETVNTWFRSARDLLARYEADAFSKAGGTAGLESFRQELREEAERLKP